MDADYFAAEIVLILAARKLNFRAMWLTSVSKKISGEPVKEWRRIFPRAVGVLIPMVLTEGLLEIPSV